MHYTPEELRRMRAYMDIDPQTLENSSGPPVSDNGDYITIRDIRCVGADGEFERHDEIRFRKDVLQTVDKLGRTKASLFTPYQAIAACEKERLFLPDAALSCNVLVRLLDAAARKIPGGSYETIDPGFRKVLDRYGRWWHTQNTLVDFERGRIIHNPCRNDFHPDHQQKEDIIGQGRVELEFDKDDLESILLDDGAHNKNTERFLRQLTGLEDLGRLIDLGEYYGRPAKLLFPWNGKNGSLFGQTRAVRLGRNYRNLQLNASCMLSSYYSATAAHSPLREEFHRLQQGEPK